MSSSWSGPLSLRLRIGISIAGAVLVAWAFLPTFEWMADKWVSDPQYSHGFLVPLFSAYLLWRAARSGSLAWGTTAPVLGGVIMVAALGLRWLAGGLMFHQLDALALLLSLSGLAAA